MTLLIKDANTQIQPISTQPDIAGNLVHASVPSSMVSGVATPVSASNPLPVTVEAGLPVIDGSGTILVGAVAQWLFGQAVPVNGYLVANTSAALLYVSDVGPASATGSSIPIPVNGVFATPPWYRPAGPVSVFGGTSGQSFAARMR